MALTPETPTEKTHTKGNLFLAWASLFRISQWVKNGFVLVPLVFSGQLLRLPQLKSAFWAFAAFSLAASGTYAINDAMDAEADSQHPRKKHRPVASGKIGKTKALGSAPLLWILALWLAHLTGHGTCTIVLIYLATTLSYTLYLKRLPVLDVMALAIGYVLRVLGGARAVQTEPTPWLLVVTLFLAMTLGFGKRNSDLLRTDAGAYSGIPDSAKLTNLYVSISATVTINAYALYAIESATAVRCGGRLVLTLPFVVMGLFRYLWLVNAGDKTYCPTEVFLSDKPIQLSILGWILAAVFALYYSQ